MFEQPIYRKVAWRIIPLLFLCYIAAYLDRVNVGFAKLQMQADVPGLTEGAYGLGAGLFFFGYFFFEVPSNILMVKFGARFWIARIMISWGLISSAMLFVNSPFLFYLLRFLLGFAEAGFFSGNHSLPDLLVPVRPARESGGLFHAGDCPDRSDRQPRLGLDSAGAQWGQKFKGLANALSP